MNAALKNKPHLTGLRTTDLIAKTAGVNIRDTARVLMALDAILDFLDVHPDELLQAAHSPDRATEHEAALCNQAYEELERFVALTDRPKLLKKIKHFVYRKGVEHVL